MPGAHGHAGPQAPLTAGSGRPGVWAAAVIYTVGANNFLFDRNSEPYLSAVDLARLTGMAKSTMANKAGAIRRCLGLHPLEPGLCRRELLEDHPYAWYVEVNGILVDVRSLPATVQDEARHRGWVPDAVALQGARR